LLHVRLARGIDDLRSALHRQSAEDEVLGRGDRGVLEPHPRRLPGAGYAEDDLMPGLADLGTERAEHGDVRIDLARAERAALDLMLEPRLAEAHEQTGDHHDRGTHGLRQAGL